MEETSRKRPAQELAQEEHPERDHEEEEARKEEGEGRADGGQHKRRRTAAAEEDRTGEDEADPWHHPEEDEEEEDETSRAGEAVTRVGGQGGYELCWEHFAGFWDDESRLFGPLAAGRIEVCDERIHPSLVERGCRVLDVLTPATPDVEHDEEDNDDEDDEYRGDSYAGEAVEALPPLEISNVGPWREDLAASRHRARVIGGQGRPSAGSEVNEKETRSEEDAIEADKGVGVKYDAAHPLVHVYRASGTVGSALHRDRFELTHVFAGYDFEYVIVVDKVESRFVFVGQIGSHPHCGTNEYVYNNSDGSGPGLFDEEKERPPPTPMALLAALRRRFVQFSADRFH